jgi:hypothetical protein
VLAYNLAEEGSLIQIYKGHSRKCVRIYIARTFGLITKHFFCFLPSLYKSYACLHLLKRKKIAATAMKIAKLQGHME